MNGFQKIFDDGGYLWSNREFPFLNASIIPESILVQLVHTSFDDVRNNGPVNINWGGWETYRFENKEVLIRGDGKILMWKGPMMSPSSAVINSREEISL